MPQVSVAGSKNSASRGPAESIAGGVAMPLPRQAFSASSVA